MKYRRSGAVLCALAMLASGCATSLDRQGRPGATRLHRVGTAFVRAAADPGTWVPAAGAVVFSLGDLDQRVSDWAYEHSFLFGSPQAANKASGVFRALACSSTFVTALAIPRTIGRESQRMTKALGLGISATAGLTNSLAVGYLKEETGKTRPNGHPGSFPSSHTSQAFTCATSAGRNLDALPLSDKTKKLLRWNFTGFAAATAWGRIESQHHYPSDTLAGAALGNFLANFLYNAFVPPNAAGGGGRAIDISVDLEDDAVRFQFGWGF